MIIMIDPPPICVQGNHPTCNTHTHTHAFSYAFYTFPSSLRLYREESVSWSKLSYLFCRGGGCTGERATVEREPVLAKQKKSERERVADRPADLVYPRGARDARGHRQGVSPSLLARRVRARVNESACGRVPGWSAAGVCCDAATADDEPATSPPAAGTSLAQPPPPS